MKIGDYETHPAADLCPLMTDDELKALASDIDLNGLIDPVTQTKDGKILDGRNRLTICVRRQLTPRFAKYSGDQPFSWVIAKNLRRRHLTPSQLAAIGAEALPELEKEARARQAHGQTAPGKNAQRQVALSVGKSSELAAQAVGASPRQIERARVVKKSVPELYEQVKAGAVTLAEATRAIKQTEKSKPADLASKPAASKVVRACTRALAIVAARLTAVIPVLPQADQDQVADIHRALLSLLPAVAELLPGIRERLGADEVQGLVSSLAACNRTDAVEAPSNQ